MNTTTQKTMKSWYGLRDDRDNFSVLPERDQEFLFGNAKWRDEISEQLELATVLREPVRLVWWGDYGIGKTHRKIIRPYTFGSNLTLT